MGKRDVEVVLLDAMTAIPTVDIGTFDGLSGEAGSAISSCAGSTIASSELRNRSSNGALGCFGSIASLACWSFS